ncbi:MAG: D-alanine--D-alanine ligase [Acidobacteria bacterium]|nr:D-alanine--D-alanine ligase [Acidobacteriota bacterium]MCB9377188.1 D-alanine--D-alanine ligase [Holophagales bacterium]
MRIALLTGGSTSERDVALAGAAQVAPALRSLGHEVTLVDTVEGVLDEERERALLGVATVRTEPPSRERLARLRRREDLPRLVGERAVSRADLVFLVLHGEQGEGGAVQGLLDLVGVRYTGSGMLASALAMDKRSSKRLLRDAGVPQADWVEWPADAAEVARLGRPVVVKPSVGGSSVGVSIVRDPGDLAQAVVAAAAESSQVLVEAALPGREFTVGVLGERALGVGEILPAHDFFDYECKYTPGLCREVFPAEIEDWLAERMRRLALETHRLLGLRDFSRIDFMLDAEGEPAVLEANTLPGMTATSLLPQSAAVCGLGFGELCGEICRLALER